MSKKWQRSSKGVLWAVLIAVAAYFLITAVTSIDYPVAGGLAVIIGVVSAQLIVRR